MYAGPLENIDWTRIWDRQWRLRPLKGDGKEYWDHKAAYLDRALQNRSNDEYVARLLERMDLTPESSVLDVGCGTGTLAIPMARRVRSVTALDLSPLMLKYLKRKATADGVKNIITMERDWREVEVGVDVEPHDIVVASRCLPMGDLRDSLRRMDNVATRTCYLTWPASDDQYEAELAPVLGTDYHRSPPYIIILNVLFALNVCAEVDLFEVSATRQFSDLDEAVSHATRGVATDSSTDRRLRAFLRGKLKRRDGLLCWDLVTRWALVSWHKSPNG